MRREISGVKTKKHATWDQRFNYRLSGLICLVCACYQFFCTMFWQSKTIYPAPVPVYLMISCNYCTNPEPIAQIMKYKVSRPLHAVTSYYTCMYETTLCINTFAVYMCVGLWNKFCYYVYEIGSRHRTESLILDAMTCWRIGYTELTLSLWNASACVVETVV